MKWWDNDPNDTGKWRYVWNASVFNVIGNRHTCPDSVYISVIGSDGRRIRETVYRGNNSPDWLWDHVKEVASSIIDKLPDPHGLMIYNYDGVRHAPAMSGYEQVTRALWRMAEGDPCHDNRVWALRQLADRYGMRPASEGMVQ